MRCTLGSKHCDALGSVGWIHTTGVVPHVQAFEMDAGEAASLINAGGDVTLTIEDKRTVTIKKLSIIGEGPASRGTFRTVLVADLRWRWARKLVTGAYNKRRHTGQKTLLSDSLIQLAQSVDDFQFAPASLKNDTTKWTPKEVMKDILEKLGDGPGLSFDFEIEGNTDQLEINDLDVRDQGPDAVTIAMQHLPGTMLWVDADGKVRVESAIGLKEAAVIESMGPDIKDEGHASKVSYQWTRPSLIRVFFVREQEVRHDSIEGDESTTQDQRYMTNVVVVTDPVATTPQGQVMFGSWTKLDNLFRYWNQTLPSADGSTPVPPPISHSMIQKMFFNDAMFALYCPFGDDIAQPLWGGRINAVKTHYRQSFQLNRRWIDRSSQIMAVRCALFDSATNTRGRSQVYGDYCVKASALPLQLKKQKGNLWKNFFGGGDSTPFSSSTEISNASVTPAIVTVVDEQAGIVHFDYRVDPYGAWKQVFPCACQNLPTSVMDDSKAKGANMKFGRDGAIPKLASSFHCATVLTHVPSYPNNNAQFYMHEVKPEDVTSLVQGLTITPAQGPVWEIFIEPGQVTARMAWLDSSAAVIERSFGVNNNRPLLGQQGLADNDELDKLLVNKDDVVAVAEAAAATIWSKLTDRYIGAKADRLNPNVVMRGSMETVAHMVTSEGAAITKVTLPEELASRSYFALLPPGTRKVVLREVIPN